MVRQNFYLFLRLDSQVSYSTFGPKRSLSEKIKLIICWCTVGQMMPEMHLVMILLSWVRIYSSITAMYKTLSDATPFQLTLYFLLDNRVCCTPYCKYKQEKGNTINTELMLWYIPEKEEWFCKDRSMQSSLQIIKEKHLKKGTETNLRLNNNFSPVVRYSWRGINSAPPAKLLTKKQSQ